MPNSHQTSRTIARGLTIVLTTVCLIIMAGHAADLPAGVRDPAHPTDEELKSLLTPLPRKSPAEALKTFETVGGFRMVLVAAEPMVYDPVAVAFDEDGNLYVGEMRDYPYPGTKQSNHTPRWKGDHYALDEYAKPVAGSHPITQSFMPEDLEAGLGTQDMADLIQFLFEPAN